MRRASVHRCCHVDNGLALPILAAVARFSGRVDSGWRLSARLVLPLGRDRIRDPMHSAAEVDALKAVGASTDEAAFR